METETQQTQNSFSDEEMTARLAAETKQLTITPISSSIQIEGISDEQIVAQHMSGPALANTSTDTEATRQEQVATATQSIDHRSGGHILAILLTGVVMLAAGGALYLLASPH